MEEVMRTWLRSVLDVILGRVPGKTSRPDTATRMMIDADFSLRREQRAPVAARKRERDDGYLIKPIGSLADAALFVRRVRIVNEAHEHDAEDERQLYDPMPHAWSSFPQPERLDPGSKF
jgi:hypothetical protein